MEQRKQVCIVPMSPEHLDEIAALEKVCFSAPWSRNMLAEELDNACSAFLTALDEGKVNADRALQMSLILHLGFMVERNVCRKHILFDGEAEFIARYGDLHRRLRECAHILEDPFEIEVSDAELCYIIQTVTQYGEKGAGHTPDPDKT